MQGGVEGGEHGSCVVVDRDEVSGHAEAFAFEGDEGAGADVVGCGIEWDGGGVIVVWISAGDCGEDVGGVFHGAGHWAYGVLVFGDGDD